MFDKARICPDCGTPMKMAAFGMKRLPNEKRLNYREFCCHNKECIVFDVRISRYRHGELKE